MSESEVESELRELEERSLVLNAAFMAEADDSKRTSIQRELNALQIAIEYYCTLLQQDRSFAARQS